MDFGLNVEEAENGQMALEKIKETKFNVVITDIKMPIMSGDKLIEEMSNIKILDNTKVIVITGGIEENIFEKYDNLKDIKFETITKPFSKELVFEKLKSIL